MAEIRHLENRRDVIFSVDNAPIWIKFQRLMQNDMWTALMWSKSKPDVEFQYGGRFGEFDSMSSQSHLPHCRVLPLGDFTVTIPEPHATLHGAVTWRNQFHDRTTLQGVIITSAILKIVFRHILFFGVFKCSLGFDERRLSYRIRYTCWFRSHSGVCVILVRDFARTTLCHKKTCQI